MQERGHRGGRGVPDERLWQGVDRLVDRAPLLSDLQNHGIELFAARRWRTQGRPVPEELVGEERAAAVGAMTAPVVLERVRAAYDRPVILMKGPEAAARYPEPTLRRFSDLDLLVENAEEAQEALLAAGFEPIGDPRLYTDIHHLRPLWLPSLPLAVEIHSRPKWIQGLEPPPTRGLFSAATESRSGVSGVLALPPAHHALLLAAHSWAHEPLRRLRDVIDVAAMAQGLDRSELRSLARSWNMERAWTTTLDAADALLLGGPTPWVLRIWAQNLSKVRERTVLENHLQRWLSSFWVLPAPKALRTLGSTLGREMRPSPDETWQTKVFRSGRAVRNALVRRSKHDQQTRRDSRGHRW